MILGYHLSGSSSAQEWESFTSNSSEDYEVLVPKSVSKIQSATVKDGKVIMVSSYGRKNDSSVYFADLSSSFVPVNVESVKGVPMMEGFCLAGDYMYFITESGAYYYYGYDKSNMAKNPTDVVWRLDYKTLMNESKFTDTAGDALGKSIAFSDGDISGTATLNFKQSWFAKNSATYNHELGQLCSQLAMIGYSTRVADSAKSTGYDYTQPSLKQALQSIGMSNIEINPRAARDEVNYFIASRTVNVDGTAKTLIFAGFIGSYMEQWYSNFDPGTGATHQGFLSAKNYVYSKLQSYISRIGASKATTEILLTGHSRGAATAGLVAAQLIKDEAYAYKENIYTYTFAAPKATTLSEKDNAEYKRIFNIVNPEDFVTKCLPAEWGYGRYGTILTLPSKTNTANYSQYLNAMQTYFKAFYGGEKYHPFSKGEYETYSVVDSLTSAVSSAEELYSRKFMWLGQYKSVQSFFTEALCPFVGEPKGSEKSDSAKDLFIDTFLNRKNSSSTILAITDYFVLNEGLTQIPIVGKFADTYFTYAHCAQTYCAYMMSMTETEIQIYRSGLMNSVNCPVDVEVIDKTTGEVVGKIVNNVVDEEIAAKENSVVMNVDGDSKQFWLPSDGYYDVVLTGNDDGEMDYTISEIDADGGELKRSNFFGVEIVDGESMTGVPEVEESSLNDYELDLGGEETLTSSAILETEQLQDVEIDIETYGYGLATGSMTVTSGDYVTLTAMPDENVEFDGWYSNGDLVSDSQTYSFVAKENVALRAVFTFNAKIGDLNGDDTINSTDALIVLQMAASGAEQPVSVERIADVNGDGKVNSSDALLILQYSVKKIHKFPIEDDVLVLN